MEIPYPEYFGLKERPFGLTPDPHFYYESETHKEALDHLRFFLAQREGFAVIYGDVGLGKTTLSRIFLSSLHPALHHSALVLNPVMDEKEFLREVLKELGIADTSGTNKDLFDRFTSFLLEEHSKGRETVLIIDEAQLLSDELLEFIRVLSNVETEKEKILHIVLFAQPEIVDRLKEPRLRYLSQRITVLYRLRSFSLEEIGRYITYRLTKAGSIGLPEFKDSALALIGAASKGCPRIVNILCDRCLLSAYAQAKTTVDAETASTVIHDASMKLQTGEIPGNPALKHLTWAAVAITLAAVAIMATLFGGSLLGHLFGPKGPGDVKSSGTAPILPGSRTPAYLVSAPMGQHVLFYERGTDEISLFRSTGLGFIQVATYRCAPGTAPGDGSSQQTAAVAEGVYFPAQSTLDKRTDPGPDSRGPTLEFRDLPGAKALSGKVILIAGKTSRAMHEGTGSDQHRHTLALEDGSIRELSASTAGEDVPLLVASQREPKDLLSAQVYGNEILAFLDSWRAARESLDADRFVGLYSDRFFSSRKIDSASFRQQKKKIYEKKSLVRIGIGNLLILMDPGGDRTAVLRFRQQYRSDNFKDISVKTLAVAKEPGGWRIIYEEPM